MSSKLQPVQLLELRRVTRTFPGPKGGFTALSEVDLSLTSGDFVAIVGKSGSGKSTLLNLLAGIDRPTSGEILVGKAAVHSMSESQLALWRGRQVGIVFQSFQLLPTLTILENVMLPLDLCGSLPPKQARQRSLELLERVGIAEQAHKLPATLSGGQQQRAAIARALANDPPLLVADEPTGNLDSRTATDVFDLLSGLTRLGKTVLVVTHERDLTSRVDRVVTLVDGKVTSNLRTTSEVRCA